MKFSPMSEKREEVDDEENVEQAPPTIASCPPNLIYLKMKN
jgi:hypothetical protein